MVASPLLLSTIVPLVFYSRKRVLFSERNHRWRSTSIFSLALMRFICKGVVGVWAAGWAAGIVASGLQSRIEESASLSAGPSFPDRHALQLVSVAGAKGGTPGSLKFHRENLENVMSTVETGIPVAIISVAGAFRSGKSFLLSLFIRSLEGHNIDPSDKSVPGGFDGDANGFSWKAGIEPNTQGMTVWSKPYFIDRSVGGRKSKMAVLLVDTQFDQATSTQIHGSLFGISTTLSSCQIYIVKGQVQTDDLEGLVLFSEYAQRAKEVERAQKVERRPFQRLEFLIRDWGNWETPDDPVTVHPAVLRKQSLKYLDGILKTKQSTDKKKVNDAFRDRIGSFALPVPGSQVAAKSYEGDIDQIDGGFQRLVTYFFQTIILGKLTGTQLPNTEEAQFVDGVEEWVDLYNKFLRSGDLPDADTYVEFFVHKENAEYRRKWMKKFKVGADELVEEDVNPAMLETKVTEHIETSLLRFSPRGDEKTRRKAKAELRSDTYFEAQRSMHIRIKEKNRRSLAHDLANMIVFVVGVCALVVFGLISRTIIRPLVKVFLLVFRMCLRFFAVVVKYFLVVLRTIYRVVDRGLLVVHPVLVFLLISGLVLYYVCGFVCGIEVDGSVSCSAYQAPVVQSR